MRSQWIALLLCGLGLSSALPLVAAAQREEPFIVGHMRKDGVVVPHFMWVDSGWRAPQPHEVGGFDSWLHVPFRGEREMVALGQAVSFPDDVMGYDAWGLQSSTRYREVKAGDAGSWPNPRIGLVLRTAVPFAQFGALPPESELNRRLAPFVKAILDTAHVDSSRRRVPGATDSIRLVVAELGRDTVVHLYAWRKLHFTDPDYFNQTEHRLAFAGVGLLRGGRLVLAFSDLEAQEDDGIGIMEPRLYSIFEYRGRRFVHGVSTGWESESPMLLEIRGDSLVGAPMVAGRER